MGVSGISVNTRSNATMVFKKMLDKKKVMYDLIQIIPFLPVLCVWFERAVESVSRTDGSVIGSD